MTTAAVILLGTGGLLIYSAIVNDSIVNTVLGIISGKGVQTGGGSFGSFQTGGGSFGSFGDSPVSGLGTSGNQPQPGNNRNRPTY